MLQIIPDSYYWTSLEQVITEIKNYMSHVNGSENCVRITPVEYEKTLDQFLLTGLENSLNHGYNLIKII